jgi:CRP-like cAMP-binding protein
VREFAPEDDIYRDRWFGTCEPAFRAMLLSAAKRRLLGAGERVFSRGDEPDGIYCVLSGAIRIGAVAESGRESVLIWLEPYRWFGEIATIDRAPRTHDAEADGPSSVLHVTRDALDAMLAEDPRRWRDLARLTAYDLRLAFLALEEVGLSSPTARVARRLLMYAQRDAIARVSQERIALLLGISRQTVNRELKRMEKRGILALGYGEITIADLAALRDIAETWTR